MRVGDIDGAIELLRNGEVIGYPTEAVYGIGCDPWNKSSVVKVAEIKNRSFEKPFLMVASSVNQLEELVDISSLNENVMKSWPGHTTWLIKAKQSTPYWLRDNETGKVGVRVSDHPMIVKLCRLYGRPLISTSANIAGGQEIREQLEFKKVFSKSISYLVDGNIGDCEKTSIIIDMETNKKLR